MRSSDSIEWARQDLEKITELAPSAALNIRIHVTGSSELSRTVYKSDKEMDEASSMNKIFSTALDPISGRADVKELVRAAGSEDRHKSVGIAACGPASLVFDVRNAVADVQKDILLGRTGCTEMFLHSEEYSW